MMIEKHHPGPCGQTSHLRSSHPRSSHLRFLFVFVLLAIVGYGMSACNNGENLDRGAALGRQDGQDAAQDDSQDAAQDAGVFPHFVLNEIAAEGEPKDWFELYNPADEAIGLSRYTYTDDFADPGKALFPPSARIEAHGYYVQYLDDASPGFKLGVDEEISIFDPALELVDMVDWKDGDSPAGTSFGRIPNGTGTFATLALPTPGAENVAGGCGNGQIDGDETCDADDLGEQTCASLGFESGELACVDDCTDFDRSDCVVAASRMIVINEVTSDDDDRIELYNEEDRPVLLSGWALADDGYDALDPSTADHLYAFAEGTTILGHSFVVLVRDVDHIFGLGKTDGLRLYDDAGLVVDEVHWSEDAASPSYCRIPDGGLNFATCSEQTFGQQNVP
ncbi:MAG: lamin tail domain-containing protein [Deltaproteobacteria bacterium]|nr:lamin tail domain-containing protein [Deltaproteobacteria bacterium]